MLTSLVAFNRGRISPLALARTDFTRTQLSAEVQTNWMPRALGSMMLRPGLQYTGASKSNLACVQLPFVYSRDDTARLEMTNSIMRVWVDDALVTRPSVTTTITNGTFNTNLTGWTDVDAGSSVSAWLAGGYMSLIGDGTAAARRRQQVTVSGANISVQHALNITITRGPVLLRVGSTAGGDDYITETTLLTGVHSLTLTPTGDFYIDLFNYAETAALVDSIAIASSGTMELATPWAAADLPNLRWDQSGDVVFVACAGYRQRRIERRDNDSWSVVTYESDNGPFMVINTSAITITPSGTTGDITLTASQSLFKSTQVGTLFKLTQTGQSASASISAENTFSSPIRVTGVDGARQFAVVITGTFSATVTLQYSIGAVGSWVDAPSGSYTTPTGIAYDDTLDNQIIYYRIGVKTGGYTSGTAEVSLTYSSGSQSGIARVTSFTSATVVNAAVLSAFGDTTATADWYESYWSAYRGYPSSVSLYEGRLWWAGKDRIWGSVSDSFANFDDETEGDSGPINRSIGSGPVDQIYWMLPMQRLLLGAGGSIWSARSSSFDEPLTPTNFNLKDVSTQGADQVNAVKIDTAGVFVQRSGSRVYQAGYDGNAYDYTVTELTAHVPEAGEPGVIRVAVQRQPETRVHFVRSDGTVAVMVLDIQEQINCWVDVETDGLVEDVCILPGETEDQVYYTVNRTVNGSTVRYHEKWALESQCQGASVNRQADSFIIGAGAVTGLDHLEGEDVVVWGDGVDQGTQTVTAGATGTSYAAWCAGLTYRARYKSTKLAYAVSDQQGTALTQKKKVTELGFIATNMHPQGVKYGPDFDTLDDMPGTEAAGDVDQDTVWDSYDYETFTFGGYWDTDSRLCLEANAPKPVTLLAAILNVETNTKR